ncbi:MAG: DUF3822 family protein [Clostridium sp.]|nr:DUF3822 family protein [Clostridium sp.]
MENSTLIPPMFDNPADWRLLMRVDPDDSFIALAYAPSRPGTARCCRVGLQQSESSPLAAVEEAVYANPALTQCEFGEMVCVVADAPVAFLPPGLGVGETESLFRRVHPDCDGQIRVVATGLRNAVAAFSVDSSLEPFLGRTFYGVTLTTPLALLCRRFAAGSARGNDRKMYLNFRSGHIDLIVIDRGSLEMANSFAVGSADDAAYYVLAARRLLGLDSAGDPLMVSGESPLKAATVATLRRFVAAVRPVIFPSDLHAEGLRPEDIPFDLAALALMQ